MLKTRLTDVIDNASPRLRAFVIFLFAAGVVGGLGCATAMVASSGNSNAPAHFNTPILTDTVFAVARPDAELAKTLGNSDAIAFLGKQNTYLLLEGGNKLMRIATELDGNRLTLVDMPRQLFLKDKTAWGRLSLNYTVEQGTSAGTAEIEKLQALGFTAGRNGSYRLEVKVKAALYPPVKVNDDQLQQFKRRRELKFFNPPDSSPPPDLDKLLVLPLAIAVDAATMPVQLFGLGVIVLGLAVDAGSHHH